MNDSTNETSPKTVGSQPTDARPLQPKRPRRRWFPVIAILVGLTPFVILEVGLRLCGIGAPTSHRDPMVGFSEINPLFELDASDGVYRTSRARGLFFGEQEFQAKKPEAGYRVFCLGGSTVRGRPYETKTAFPKWMQIELSALEPNRTFECVNCGGLSYASYRLNLILDEVLNYEPDLIVIATGHNEFLEDRTYSTLKDRSAARQFIENRLAAMHTINLIRDALADDDRLEPQLKSKREGVSTLGGEVRERLTAPGGYASYKRDDQWTVDVQKHFALTVRTMIEKCKAAGFPVQLVNLGSNVRDTPPFKSQLRMDLTSRQSQAWQKAFELAGDLDLKNPEEALEQYRKAHAIDNEHALLLYRMARCLTRIDQRALAEEYFLKAKDLDICPLRIFESMRKAIADIGVDTGTPVIDAELYLRNPSHPAGYDWYMDHVHPTIDGQQRLAEAIVNSIRDRNLIEGLASWSDTQRREAYQRHLTQLGPVYLANGRERVGWLESWAQRNRLYAESLPTDARGNLYRGMRRSGFGEFDSAWEDIKLAIYEKPEIIDELIQYIRRIIDQGTDAVAWELIERTDKEYGDRVGKELSELRALLSPQD